MVATRKLLASKTVRYFTIQHRPIFLFLAFRSIQSAELIEVFKEPKSEILFRISECWN